MPKPIEKSGTIAAGVGVDASVGTAVSKHIRVAVKGYFASVDRLRQAVPHGSKQPDDVYIALTEAVSWLWIIANATGNLGENKDAVAVTFARNRSDHHLASMTYFDEDEGTQVWRPETQLPDPPKHPNKESKALYKGRLAARPVLEVFDRLEPVVATLTTPK
jgi:hypothetical protein